MLILPLEFSSFGLRPKRKTQKSFGKEAWLHGKDTAGGITNTHRNFQEALWEDAQVWGRWDFQREKKEIQFGSFEKRWRPGFGGDTVRGLDIEWSVFERIFKHDSGDLGWFLNHVHAIFWDFNNTLLGTTS